MSSIRSSVKRKIQPKDDIMQQSFSEVKPNYFIYFSIASETFPFFLNDFGIVCLEIIIIIIFLYQNNCLYFQQLSSEYQHRPTNLKYSTLQTDKKIQSRVLSFADIDDIETPSIDIDTATVVRINA